MIFLAKNVSCYSSNELNMNSHGGYKVEVTKTSCW